MNDANLINGNDGDMRSWQPSTAPWLSALLAGALALPGGCVGDAEPSGGPDDGDIAISGVEVRPAP